MPSVEPSPKIATGVVARSASRVPDIHAHLDDPRWQLARRIADSGGLGRSRLLADFLVYIVDRHIRDRTDEITEQQIGILVFGRAEGYDSSDDNIVRSYARTLRKRIDEYFATEGKAEKLRLEIPRGGYSPAFSAGTSQADSLTGDSGFGQTAPASAGNEMHSSLVTPVDPESGGAEVGRAPDDSGPVPTTWWPAAGRAALHRFGVPLALCLGILVGLAT